MATENDFVNYPRMVSGYWVHNAAADAVASRGLDPKTTPPTQDYSLPVSASFANTGLNNRLSGGLNSFINELSTSYSKKE
jgi:hypothetical protein